MGSSAREMSAHDREMSTRDGSTREGTALSMPRATTGGVGAELGGLTAGWGSLKAATRLRPRPYVSAEMPTPPPPRPQPKRGTTTSTPGGAAPPPGAAAALAANNAATAAAAALPAAQSNPGGRVSPSVAPRPGAVSPTGREIVAAGADGSRVSPPRREVSPPPPGSATSHQRQRGMARTGHTRHAAAASPAKPQPGVNSPKGVNPPDPQPTFEALPALGGGVARGAGSAAAAAAPSPPKAETARGRAEAAKAEAQMRASGQVRHLAVTPSRCAPAVGCAIPTANSRLRRVTYHLGVRAVEGLCLLWLYSLLQAGKARVPGKGSSSSNMSLQRQAAAQPNSSSELRSLDKMMR